MTSNPMCELELVGTSREILRCRLQIVSARLRQEQNSVSRSHLLAARGARFVVVARRGTKGRFDIMGTPIAYVTPRNICRHPVGVGRWPPTTSVSKTTFLRAVWSGRRFKKWLPMQYQVWRANADGQHNRPHSLRATYPWLPPSVFRLRSFFWWWDPDWPHRSFEFLWPGG
jgi:hypothetical protein